MLLRRGSSLVEVVVAVALLAVIAQAAAALFVQSLRWQTLARHRLEQLDDVRTVLAAHQTVSCGTQPFTPPLLHPLTVDVVVAGPLQSIEIRSGHQADSLHFTLLRGCE
jgi:type II secretory pathway pseudopilin PulG